MVKKRRGAAEVEVRREEGVAEVVVVESERREVVGSSWFWRWRRFDSMIRND